MEKEALKWCEQFTDNLVKANVDTKRRTLGLQAMQVCKSALEKQIPKKPIKIEETYNVEMGEWVADYECPSCGNPYADDSYCSCCGQALDWSDTE
jgi:hypothetical protein